LTKMTSQISPETFPALPQVVAAEHKTLTLSPRDWEAFLAQHPAGLGIAPQCLARASLRAIERKTMRRLWPQAA
jgi:hypothetical protein